MNQIKFGIEDAKRVITEMRLCYGKKFADQWVGVDPMDLANKMVQMFSDLNPNDLDKGFQKMQTQAWCPTLPEFKSWCIGDLKAQWLGSNEAWNIARGSIDFNGYELTVVWTKECAIAFDAVVDMVKLGDKYQIAEAKKVFTERYDRLVLESLERGEKPVYTVSYGDDKEQRKTALKQAEIAGLLPATESNKMIEMIQSPQDAKNEEVKFKTLAQEHLAKLKEVLKKPNQKQDIPEKEIIEPLKLSGNLPEWADPFDDFQNYKQGLDNDKKPVPMTLRQ